MKESLETIINSLVSDLSSVSIEEKDDGRQVVFQVKVAESDMGRVIGREGRIAKAIRTIMKALATKEGKKVSVEFID